VGVGTDQSIHLISVPGGLALSPFRLEKLVASCAADLALAGSDLSPRYVHYIRSSAELTAQQVDLCERLLSYADASGSDRNMGLPHESTPLLTVVPRLGTISPWSSKATDIFHVCGLETVLRVERGVCWYVATHSTFDPAELGPALSMAVHDPMTESVLASHSDVHRIFEEAAPKPYSTISLGDDPVAALSQANTELGLALSTQEIEYLIEQYSRLARDPTDVELMMFAQANSEHCRHKIFNASWSLDGARMDASLFGMVRETHAENSQGTLVAYDDNAAVLTGHDIERFAVAGGTDRRYRFSQEAAHIVAKVETHNHPTAISPYAGAATGSGGEIRDEGATGRGARPKAGLTGFSVSNLRLPERTMPWELEEARPARIASALDIMLDGPIGGASFNNEFGRPGICGFFRTLETPWAADEQNHAHRWGYHKPIMLAGGIGSIRTSNVRKEKFESASHIIVLGGPAMLIGMGGGAASSMVSGESSEQLDFASVQRSNPEMQRRCQEVIDACTAMDDDNPILAIHDVGAGGLSNAVPELIYEAGRGGNFELRNILIDEPGMNPMQVWCNESQERYVIAISDARLEEFKTICERERCLYAILGQATEDGRLVLTDRQFPGAANDQSLNGVSRPIDIDLNVMLGKPPKLHRDASRQSIATAKIDTEQWTLSESLDRVLHLPGVADKSFLVTIGDRTVTGLVARDSMVGPWQVPVSDVAVTAAGFRSFSGEAMALGERAPIAIVDAAASARMALAEAVTNIAAADIDSIDRIRLSANWMAAAGHDGQDAALFDAVATLTRDVCVPLGISIPVGKDSLSMRTVWSDADHERSVTAPVSLVISAFSPVSDIRRTLTPVLSVEQGDSRLLLIDLGGGRQRLAGSALAQVYNQIGDEVPDLQSCDWLKAFFHALRAASRAGLVLAYHDRSDGGLLTTVLEMAFASRLGIELNISELGSDVHAALFAEETGAVMQVREKDVAAVQALFDKAGIGELLIDIGCPVAIDRVTVQGEAGIVFDQSRTELQQAWSETSWHMQRMRDNPECADEEYARIADSTDLGLGAARLSPGLAQASSAVHGTSTPKLRPPSIAVLREQGVNGHIEMAAAFTQAGFQAVDVTMTDIIAGRDNLSQYQGFVACGGFSFGDVLGGGQGWAKAILYNARARDVFSTFFDRTETFTLGVCNGCQMLAGISELIPGADDWPVFVKNRSEQFEGRLTLVEIADTASVLTPAMVNARLPIAVSHGEGYAQFDSPEKAQAFNASGLVVMRYADGRGQPTERYPFNPNGSPYGIAGVTTVDGRFNALMPHPERVFRVSQHSWAPPDWSADGPWLELFRNARRFCS